MAASRKGRLKGCPAISAGSALARAIRRTEAADRRGRNVAALIRQSAGQRGRLSKALSLERARAPIAAAVGESVFNPANDVSRWSYGLRARGRLADYTLAAREALARCGGIRVDLDEVAGPVDQPVLLAALQEGSEAELLDGAARETAATRNSPDPCRAFP